MSFARSLQNKIYFVFRLSSRGLAPMIPMPKECSLKGDNSSVPHAEGRQVKVENTPVVPSRGQYSYLEDDLIRIMKIGLY